MKKLVRIILVGIDTTEKWLKDHPEIVKVLVKVVNWGWSTYLMYSALDIKLH
jgi:hypothetical protein